jgi:hypothetical protein
MGCLSAIDFPECPAEIQTQGPTLRLAVALITEICYFTPIDWLCYRTLPGGLMAK